MAQTVVRMEMLDAVRFLAAVGVILLHSVTLYPPNVPLGALGRFAVPFFTMVAVALTVDGIRRKPGSSLKEYVTGRFQRIYAPFLVWTAIYLLLRNVKYQFITHEPWVWPNWSMLLSGSAHHLWFLPFILGVTLAVAFLAKFMLFRLPVCGVIFLSIVAAVATCYLDSYYRALSVLGSEEKLGIAYFLSMVRRTLPSALLGLAFGRVWSELQGVTGRAALAWGGLVVAVAALAFGPTFNYCLELQILSGLGTVFFALGPWNNGIVRLLARWGQNAYGIYLVHVFWYLMLELVFHRLHLAIGSASIWLIVFLTVALSTASALWFSQSRRTAWMMGSVSPSQQR